MSVSKAELFGSEFFILEKNKVLLTSKKTYSNVHRFCVQKSSGNLYIVYYSEPNFIYCYSNSHDLLFKTAKFPCFVDGICSDERGFLYVLCGGDLIFYNEKFIELKKLELTFGDKKITKYDTTSFFVTRYNIVFNMWLRNKIVHGFGLHKNYLIFVNKKSFSVNYYSEIPLEMENGIRFFTSEKYDRIMFQYEDKLCYLNIGEYYYGFKSRRGEDNYIHRAYRDIAYYFCDGEKLCLLSLSKNNIYQIENINYIFSKFL